MVRSDRIRRGVTAGAELSVEPAADVERAQRYRWPAGSASLRRSPRCGDSPALLDPRSHRETRFVRCAHCAQTIAMSQMTKRARARADHGSALLGVAAGAAPATHPHLCVNRRGLLSGRTRGSSQSLGRVAGRAPLRRRGAQGLGGCASPQGEASSEACLSTEHRQPAQQDAARARASSALAPEHRAPQGSRRGAPTAATKHDRPPAHGFATLDRSSEADHGIAHLIDQLKRCPKAPGRFAHQHAGRREP
jgi:hypothetical protein